MMKINKPPFLYRIGKFILGPIYKNYYRPKIVGLENIPKESNYILASNHIHLYDQCNSIISIKRNLVFMAKDEYFKSWKTRWFFKGVGCIPVDRTKKDANAVSSAIDTLNKGGVLGIFPEGTRNALKDEKINDLCEKYYGNKDNYVLFKQYNPKLSQVNCLIKLYENKIIKKKDLLNNLYSPDQYLKKILKEDEYYDSLLLDLKYGAVSMANKSGVPIVPVIITGDYKKHSNNLVIRYGKPIYVSDNLEKENKSLRNVYINMLKENLRDSLENN